MASSNTPLPQPASPSEVVTYYRQALALEPNSATVNYNLGVAYKLEGNLAAAIGCYRRAIALQPDFALAYNNLGNALKEQGQLDEAFECYQQALQLQPHQGLAHHNLGVFCQEQGRLAEALKFYQQALLIEPNSANIYNGLGIVHRQSGQFPLALQCYQKALQLQPHYADAHYNLGQLLLLLGNFQQGWAEAEWRWQTLKFKKFVLQTPMWDGAEIEGKSIILWSEQGMGDSIQFVRYAQELQERGARVTISTYVPLVPLFQECLAGTFTVVDQNKCNIYAYDLHVSLMSLPFILKTNFDSIPHAIPYLVPPQPLRSQCILPHSESYRLGIVWASQADNPLYRQKSCAPELLIDLLALGNICLYSLQVGVDASQIQPWLENERVQDLSPLIKDFVDTASIIEQLDLVITVDTAVAHLAGAMGKAVWVLLPFAPDWRWLLERQDTPWYPTMRLFRQPQPGDWVSVFSQVKEKLLR